MTSWIVQHHGWFVVLFFCFAFICFTYVILSCFSWETNASFRKYPYRESFFSFPFFLSALCHHANLKQYFQISVKLNLLASICLFPHIFLSYSFSCGGCRFTFHSKSQTPEKFNFFLKWIPSTQISEDTCFQEANRFCHFLYIPTFVWTPVKKFIAFIPK